MDNLRVSAEAAAPPASGGQGGRPTGDEGRSEGHSRSTIIVDLVPAGALLFGTNVEPAWSQGWLGMVWLAFYAYCSAILLVHLLMPCPRGAI